MTDLPPTLRQRQRLFLLLALIFPVFLLGIMGLQISGWNKGANDPDFLLYSSLFLLAGFGIFVLPALLQFWLTRRYYLMVANGKPMPDELFVAGCSNLAGTPVLPELALEIRETIEVKLMLPSGTLKPDTNLEKFGMWAYFLYTPALSEKFHLTNADFKGCKSNTRIMANFVHVTEEILRSRQYVREEPAQTVSQGEAITGAFLVSAGEPLVLRETSKLFRRWVFSNLIAVPFCLVLGYFCSLGGTTGTVIAILFFGFFLFATLVLMSCFPTITIDPSSHRVTLVNEVFGIIPLSRKETSFDDISLVRVYEHQASEESEQIIQQVYLITHNEESGWPLGDNAKQQMGPHCDVEVARKISTLMKLPLEIVQHAPPPPRWMRRFYGAVKENSSDGKQKR